MKPTGLITTPTPRGAIVTRLPKPTLEKIESLAANPLLKLANPQFRPSPEEVGHVYLFVVLMFARVPSWREHLNKVFASVAQQRVLRNARDKEAFYSLCVNIERDTGQSLGDHEELRQSMFKGDYEIVQGSTAYNLNMMFKSALTIATELQSFDYEVLYAPKGSCLPYV